MCSSFSECILFYSLSSRREKANRVTENEYNRAGISQCNFIFFFAEHKVQFKKMANELRRVSFLGLFSEF